MAKGKKTKRTDEPWHKGKGKGGSTKPSVRKGLKKGIQKRTEDSHRSKDQGLFNSYYTQPPNTKRWPADSGEHTLDLIPYAAGENNLNGVKAGDGTYNVDVWVHTRVGINEDTVLCLAKMFNRPCPICEERDRLRKEGEDDDVLKEMKPKRRCLYVVWDRDREREGLMVMDVAHWFFEHKIAGLAKDRKTGEYIFFADPDEGRHIAFTIARKGQNMEYTDFQLLERDDPIPDRILNAAPCLDDYIIIPTYEEVERMYYGGDSPAEQTDDEEEEEDLPEDFGSLDQDEEDPDEDDEEDDSDDEEEDDEDSDDEEEEEEDLPEEDEDDEEDDSDDEEEEDDEPEPPKKRRGTSKKAQQRKPKKSEQGKKAGGRRRSR